MKMKLITVLLLMILSGCPSLTFAQVLSPPEKGVSPGAWYCYRTNVELESIDGDTEIRMAADSKYWLWINGNLEVFEGALKRGPNPKDTYCDVIKNSRHFKKGKNTIAVLLWYFGIDGFSHRSTDTPGITFSLKTDQQQSVDLKWKVRKHPAYYVPTGTRPNYRLPESNIGYNANEAMDFIQPDYDDSKWKKPVTVSLEKAGWNRLIDRPIPFWRDYGLKTYTNIERKGDTLFAYLPYNAQITPYLKIKSKPNITIDIRTDNYEISSAPNVYAEYVTRDGEQEYESLGWMNGHYVKYTISNEVEVLELKYRETGYDTDFSGSFFCDDPMLNSLWNKAQRTLYITMRDTYMDCPDRERSQWWGDVVNELGEAFYALDEKSHLLTRKGIRELMDWQRPDSTIYSPVPSGNWHDELPMQMLASVGYYGFWTYYMGTGDRETIAHVFPKVKKYLSVWKINDEDLVIPREGGWLWVDWGENKDAELLFSLWYIIALDGYKEMANLLSQNEEAAWANVLANRIRESFHKKYWNGKYYVSPNYKGLPDDRSQALAVVSGVTPDNLYPAIRSFFKEHHQSSPYMEKYVLQALCQMGYHQDAMDRMKNRFRNMIESQYTTLWEGWGIGSEGYGGGSYNHAWSGGPLTIMSQYIAGIETIEPAFKRFAVKPNLGNLNVVKTTVPLSGQREILLNIYKNTNEMRIHLNVPEDTEAELYLPSGYTSFKLNQNGVEKTSGKMYLKSGNWILTCYK